ncbi:MAG: YdeI/OmpD-associated family protein [Kofleriaceae bacterium]
MTRPTYFATPEAFHAWLAEHHADRDELLVGFHKRDSGTPSMTWPESVDQALCFGWIDGVRRNVDAKRYSIRFTPRRATTNWSAINIAKAEQLVVAGKMAPAGLAAFEARSEARSRIYAYERAKAAALAPADERRFQANQRAWTFFSGQPPGYRRTATHWVISAKKAETRAARLAQLIADSAAGLRIKQLRR